MPSADASLQIEALKNNISYADLLTIERPAQYLGGEVNSVTKYPSAQDVRLALAFPDSYEIGMSHAGLHLLYQIANSLDYCWAERAFMPLSDMEQLLRDKQSKLFSLESATSLDSFDILGFTLQYELCATNVLAMLELGGIALRAKDRCATAPIVMGGGSYAMHAAPLAPFFDLFFLGEAEHGLVEVLEAIRQWKLQGSKRDRSALIQELSTIEGVLPAEAYYTHGTAPAAKPRKRRTLAKLNNEPYLSKPVLAHSRIIHDRMPIELMRGCVRGCRFCQAGFLYRPHRERSPDEVVSIVKESLANSGFEEIGLLSLSTADYCALSPLLKSLMDSFAAEKRVSISLPSTRVDAVRPEIMEQIARVRKTGFTLAPEGGSERLRNVINKGFSEQDILNACQQVFEAGWESIKLYFMIGLPTETDEDLEAIIDLASKIKSIPAAKRLTITVSASTFIPKPHTPFQWARQISGEEAYRRQELLKAGLKKIRVNFRYQRTFASVLEGLLARGGCELAEVIQDAYQQGARFEAWDEHRREDLWLSVLDKHGINLETFFDERNSQDLLPWDCTTSRVSRSFLLKEWRQAHYGKTTASCISGPCSNCGVCNDELENIRYPAFKGSVPAATPTIEPQEITQRLRLRFSKQGSQALVSHLELAGMFHRCCRRAGFPLAYSEGFHPLPRLIFGPPLQLGIPSLAEYVDMYLVQEINPLDIIRILEKILPKGMNIEEVSTLDIKAPAISESTIMQRFEIVGNADFGGFQNPVAADQLLLSRESITPIIVESYLKSTIDRAARVTNPKTKRRKTKKARTFLLQEHLTALELFPNMENTQVKAVFDLSFQPQIASPKPFEIAQLLTGRSAMDYWLRKTEMVLRS